MNSHLNVFRHYAETSWENNLTRALGITLNNDPLFFSTFFEKITGENIINYFDSSSEVNIDTQISIENIPKEYEILYPVALTTGDIDLLNISSRNTTKPIADLVITINNICILIEIKITNEDCIKQLNNQVEVFKKDYLEKNLEIKETKALKWEEIVKIADTVYNFNSELNNNSIMLKEFLEYIGIHYPKWLPVKRFYEIPLPKNSGSKEDVEINKRIENLKIEISEGEMTKFKSRTSVLINKPWASELNMFMREDRLILGIWPGDTKGQGWNLFNRNPNLTFLKFNETSRKIDDISYNITIRPYLRFSHFSKGITWLEINLKEKNYEFKKIFDNITGRWQKENWHDFEKKMSNLISEKWIEECGYKEFIIESNRTYFDIALGFELYYHVKYSDVQLIEKKGTTKIFFTKLKDDLINIIENTEQGGGEKNVRT